MNVYLAILEIAYEGQNILGAFSNYDKAQKFLDDYKSTRTWWPRDHYFQVDGWIVQ